ncbi:hypothetical protein Patl1_13073 [Pistacia atlantica]|uniref:Uncharacterized protein n=1 Tax=Pistacia atlantica TaxID=434234 RepID=A0ACC1AUZ4_9ROSI|nr:hypothetical protein Patl1_13073 [Pistacia atlantica]
MVGEMASSETANEEVCFELPAPSGWKKKLVFSPLYFYFLTCKEFGLYCFIREGFAVYLTVGIHVEK